MKKLIPITVIFLFFVFALTYVSVAEIYAESDPPQISAASAVVMDSATGRILYEKNGYSRQFPASTTKIMTGLLAIQSGHKLNEMVEISENAATEEGSSIYMQAGEKISFEDLIYALMLRSGNDSAVALAEYISGSEKNFVQSMNEKAKQIGAKDTNFVTASGLHDDYHYTTAYDMALFAREAMKDEYFRKVVQTQSWNASRDTDKFNYFYNKNKVLHQYDGGNGIKIGYTKAAGRCLVASSQRDGMELIAVVFSAPDWFNDTYKLMDYIYDNYEAVTFVKAGVPLAAVEIVNGEKERTWLVTDHDVVYPQKEGEKTDVSFKISSGKNIKAPIKRGSGAGSIDIYYNGEKVGSEKLVFREDIDSGEKTGIGAINNLLSFITNLE